MPLPKLADIGRVIAEGDPATMMTAERLQRIFSVGMGAFSHPQRHEPIPYLL
ncbi:MULTISPECIES: hypothetical protein [Rhizobium]|uniref:hypothetical protein n=1 Tax=Rhizobium TaxID=379 RepID=UPI00195616B7|nr:MULTISPECIES: hypothetical protein [Rhizobium]MBM7047033.1 hypothetical protein [Rhizobium lusitanum]